MSALNQLPSKIEMIVYFTVKDDRDLAVSAPHGLKARLDVQNGKPTMPQEDGKRIVMINTLAVRTAVREG